MIPAEQARFDRALIRRLQQRAGRGGVRLSQLQADRVLEMLGTIPPLLEERAHLRRTVARQAEQLLERST